MIFISHILACFLCLQGYTYPLEDGQEEDEYMWIAYNNSANGLWGVETATPQKDIFKIYIFAFYWVWEVITTVGFGDRAMYQTDVYGISLTLFIEFIGVIMQAILIDVMANFIAASHSFQALVTSKL